MAATTQDSLFTAPTRAAHYSPNYGGTLTIVGRSWPAGTGVHELDSAPADRVLLAADGRGWCEQAHDAPRHGALSGDVVYVELHRADGTGFHGFVDAKSRRLVQIG